MKTRNLFLIFMSVGFPFLSFSQETEPNDVVAQANTLGVNGTNSGSLSDIDLDDWWQITIPADGQLVINTTSDVGLDVDLYLYDVNGTTQIASYDISSGIYEAVHYNNLMPGTYYVKAHRWVGLGSYSISSTFTSASLTNDAENNDSVQVAITLPLNGSSTGHLGFYTNGYTDIYDWWKVVVPEDGKLEINTASDSTLDVDLYLYDINGTTQIASYDISSGIYEAIHYNNLMPGTYYVNAKRWTGYGSYTISSTFTATSLINDVENNDSVEVAITLLLNDSSTGHLGFYTNGYTDIYDWWKVVVPEDGKLEINTASDSTLDVDLFLYDINGTTQIASYDISSGIYEAIHYNNLMSGTYYVNAKRWTGYGSYTISSTFTAALLTNDTENNDSVEVAITLPLNGSSTGHLGFYTNGYTDLVDWWKVTIPYQDTLIINTVSDATLDLDLFLYGTDGTTQIASYDISSGIYESTHYNDLPAGTYYVKALRWSGYGSYTIESISTISTGIENSTTAYNSLIYLNNKTNKIIVSVEEGINSIEIYNVLGKKLYSNSNLNNTSIEINIANYESGIYIVNARDDRHKVVSKKIVKQ